MDYKRIVDKYITRSGRVPQKPREIKPKRAKKGGTVTISEEGYRRLLDAAACDDTIGSRNCLRWSRRSLTSFKAKDILCTFPAAPPSPPPAPAK